MSKLKVNEMVTELTGVSQALFEKVKGTQLEIFDHVQALKRIENELLEKHRIEQERLEQERAYAEQLAREAEQQRLEQEAAEEAARIAAEEEAARQAELLAEQQRQAKLEKEQALKAAQQKLEQEKQKAQTPAEPQAEQKEIHTISDKEQVLEKPAQTQPAQAQPIQAQTAQVQPRQDQATRQTAPQAQAGQPKPQQTQTQQRPAAAPVRQERPAAQNIQNAQNAQQQVRRPQQQQQQQGGTRPPARMGGGPFQPRPAGSFTPRQQQGGQGYGRPAQAGAAHAGGQRAAHAGGAPRGGQPARPGAARPLGGRPAPAAPAQNNEKERVSNYDPNRSAYQRDQDRKARQRRTIKEIGKPRTEDEGHRYKRPKKAKQQVRKVIEPIIIDKITITGNTITIKELAEKTGKPSAEIIKKLLVLGIFATINQEIDYDTAELLAQDYNITVEQRAEKSFEDVLLKGGDKEDDEADLETRPPVVTIMGHVDHGKTSLLDKIRATSVAEGEAGGITQHIGAYTIEKDDRTITFLDTPGHEAFTAMRARGAQVTDIAILVVAADDGVKPQTVEAINHAKAAEIPIVVAVNKIDRAEANVERIKQELTEYELVAEEWGGDTVIAPVSAKTGEGIEHLLELVLLLADMQELKANPNRLAKGTIIEAQLDKGSGPVATVLVQNGTLRLGDTIVAGVANGRVRAMSNDKGEKVELALPSQPVEVLGFNDVPAAGDILFAVEEDKLSRQVVAERRDKQKAQQLKTMSKVSLDDLFTQIAQGNIKDLNVVVKADVQGSVEALRQSLERLSNEEVRVRCIHGGVGAINQSDIMLASASNAIILGFNVRPDSATRSMAEKENVDIRLYRVIYNAIEDIEKAMKGLLAPQFKDVEIGRIEVRQVFKVTGVGTVAGCYVQEGKAMRNARVRVVRDGILVHEGTLSSLKRFKDDAKEVAAGYECGASVTDYNDIKEGDILEMFIIEEVER